MFICVLIQMSTRFDRSRLTSSIFSQGLESVNYSIGRDHLRSDAGMILKIGRNTKTRLCLKSNIRNHSFSHVRRLEFPRIISDEEVWISSCSCGGEEMFETVYASSHSTDTLEPLNNVVDRAYLLWPDL